MRTRAIVTVAAASLITLACGSKGDPGPAGAPGQSGPGNGLTYEIQSVTLRSGAAPEVKFKVTDDTGHPLALKNGDGTLAFTPQFTVARRAAGGRFESLLVRDVTGKPYVGSDGQTKQPASQTAKQASSESTAATGAADRVTGGDGGVYTYTFASPIADVDAGATHRVGVWGSRTVNGVAWPASHTLDFVPNGANPSGNDLVTDNQCNRCHGVVRAHGDQRLGVKLCITCHESHGTPDAPINIDPETGNSVYMPTMVHKIHRGKDLDKGYTIVGFAAGNPSTIPNSSVLAFGEHVTMAPSHSTYIELSQKGTGTAGSAPVNDPGLVRRCELCHGEQASTVLATQSLSKCAACHDKIDPATGQGHTAGPQPDNSCNGCHNGAAGSNGAITIPTFTQAHSEAFETTRNVDLTPASPHKLEVKIEDVTSASPGSRPIVDFTVKLDGQPYDISTKGLSALGFQMAGPVQDYARVIPTTAATSTSIAVSPGVSSALVSNAANVNNVANTAVVSAVDAANGRFRFQFPASAALPADAKGTFVFSYEAMWKDTKKGPNDETISKPYAAQPVFHGAERNVQYRDVSGGAPSERRSTVSNDKCNTCHVDLGFHSNRSRKGIDYCATCHDPNLDNRGRVRFEGPVGTKKLVESVSANVFIHRIHMGAELPSVRAGGTYELGAIRDSGSTTFAGPEAWNIANNGEEGFADFRRFESPRPVFACDTCHVSGGNALATSAGRLPIRRALLNCATVKPDAPDQGWCSTRTVDRETFTPPTTAVCTSCHDSDAAKAHAALNTIFKAGQTSETYNPYNAPTDRTVDPSKEALETCATCHGVGRDVDVTKIHTGPTFLQ